MKCDSYLNNIFSVWVRCMYGWQCLCHRDLSCIQTWRLVETTWSSWLSQVRQAHIGWGGQCDSELSTLDAVIVLELWLGWNTAGPVAQRTFRPEYLLQYFASSACTTSIQLIVLTRAGYWISGTQELTVSDTLRTNRANAPQSMAGGLSNSLQVRPLMLCTLVSSGRCRYVFWYSAMVLVICLLCVLCYF